MDRRYSTDTVDCIFRRCTVDWFWNRKRCIGKRQTRIIIADITDAIDFSGIVSLSSYKILGTDRCLYSRERLDNNIVFLEFSLVKRLIGLTLKSIAKILILPLVISTVLILLLSLDVLESISHWKYHLIILKGVGFPALFIFITFIFTDIPKMMIRDVLKRNS